MSTLTKATLLYERGTVSPSTQGKEDIMILLHPPAYVVPDPQMLIPFSPQKFDPKTGNLVDEETRDRLRRFLSALAEWAHRLEEPLKASQKQARGRTA
jgi:hypothetical protein